MDNFQVKLSKGKFTESIVKKNLEDKLGYNVQDVSDVKEWQDKDVDFIVSNANKSIHFALEVKNDDRMHQTGNFFFEIGFDRKTGFYKGWWYKCKAHALCFFDSVTGTGYILDFGKVKALKGKDELLGTGLFEYKEFDNRVDECKGRAWLLNIDKAIENNLIVYWWKE